MNGRSVYFIRHGQTEDNAKNVYIGQSDPPLNDHGRRQAREAVPEVAKLQVTHIYSSDLLRAYETAATLAEGIRFPVDLIRPSADLREVAVGSLTGKPFLGRAHIDEMRRHDPGIESREHVYSRLRQLWDELPAEGNLLLVGHEGCFVLLMAMLTGADPLELPGLENCKIAEVEPAHV